MLFLIWRITGLQKQKTGTLKDISLAEAGRYGTLNEFAFFDKVIKLSVLSRGLFL